MHAELFQPVTTSVPAIRTLSVDSEQGFAGYGDQSLRVHRSEASVDLMQLTGRLLLLLLLLLRMVWSFRLRR